MLIPFTLNFVTECVDGSELSQRISHLDYETLSRMCKEILEEVVENQFLPEINEGWSEMRVMTLTQALGEFTADEAENYLREIVE